MKRSYIQVLGPSKEVRGLELSVNIVDNLKILIDKFLQGKLFDQDGELILPRIIGLCSQLECSPVLMVTKIKLQRLKILLKDINENRYRVTTILTRLDETEDDDKDDIVNALKSLRRDELISPEQYVKLMIDDAAFDPKTIVKIIKNTKVGSGLKFLPTELIDLKNKIKSAISEENNISLKDILVYLDEMFRKNGISENDYQSIKNEIDNVK